MFRLFRFLSGRAKGKSREGMGREQKVISVRVPSRDSRLPKGKFSISRLCRLRSLRSRREWVPARTSVPNASAKSRVGREEACEGISGFAAKSFARAPTPASYAGYRLRIA